MSIIENLSSLYCNSSTSHLASLLTLDHRDSLAQEFDSIILSVSRKNSETRVVDLDDLHLKARLETEDGRKLVEYCMPPPMEMFYRQNTISALLKRQPHFSEEQMDCPQRRDNLASYILHLHSKSQFKIQTLHQAISIADGYFCRRSISPEKDRLLGVTALWIARKMEETKMQRLASWLKVVECFSCEEVIEMEAEVLESFGYEVGLPTSYSFLEILATYFSMSERALVLCSYLLEMALLDCRYLNYKRSLLAVSSLYLSFKILDPSQWNPIVLDIFKVTQDELNDCSHSLLKALQGMQKKQQGGTYRKYSSGQFYRIAKIRFWPPIE